MRSTQSMAGEADASGPRQLFGHPVGLAYVVAAEGLIYFAYSGLQAVLTLYLTQQLFTAGHAGEVIGFRAYRAALEWLFGPMTLFGLASQTFGLFTGLTYALPLLGALIADRWLGRNRTIVIGMAVLAVGYALVTAEAALLIGLGLAILGNGLLKTNLLGQIGRLYAPGDQRGTRGFGIYLIAINIGAFVSPLACGGLATWVGWRAGLAPPALATAAALIVYAVGRGEMPADTLRHRRDGHSAPARLRAGDGRTIAALLVFIAIDILFVGTYNQSFDVLPVWANAHVDRDLFGFVMPASWFSSLDGVFTIVGTALSMRLWAWQARRGREAGDVAKFAIGAGIGTAAFAILSYGAASSAGATPIGYPVVYFALIDTAISWTDLVVMSLVSRAAPPAVSSTLLAVYLMSTMVANLMVGGLGTLYERMRPAAFWGMHALIVASALPLLLLVGRWIHRSLVAAGDRAEAPGG